MHHFGVAGQGGHADPGRLVTHPLQHVLGSVDDAPRDRVGHRLQHDQVAEPLEQVGGEPARVVAGVDDALHRAEQRSGVTGGQRVDRIVDQGEVGGPQQGQRPLVGDVVAVGPGQQLVEHAQRVAG